MNLRPPPFLRLALFAIIAAGTIWISYRSFGLGEGTSNAAAISTIVGVAAGGLIWAVLTVLSR
jgi:hypothetical protein